MKAKINGLAQSFEYSELLVRKKKIRVMMKGGLS